MAATDAPFACKARWPTSSSRPARASHAGSAGPRATTAPRRGWAPPGRRGTAAFVSRAWGMRAGRWRQQSGAREMRLSPELNLERGTAWPREGEKIPAPHEGGLASRCLSFTVCNCLGREKRPDGAVRRLKLRGVALTCTTKPGECCPRWLCTPPLPPPVEVTRPRRIMLGPPARESAAWPLPAAKGRAGGAAGGRAAAEAGATAAAASASSEGAPPAERGARAAATATRWRAARGIMAGAQAGVL